MSNFNPAGAADKSDVSRTVENAVIQQRDESLIKAACAGDSASFAKLISLYQKKVRALGLGFFKNQTDTDDFVQDVFLKVYTNLSSFRGESMFSTWLLRIAYNTAVNSVKRRKEYVSLSEDFELHDNDLGPEEKQIRDVTAQAVREALQELPEKYASCLDLYFFHDMPYSDISETADLPVNTIKSHIFRAKKMLRDKLAEMFPID